MDRKLARRNLMTGLMLAAIVCVMFGLTFLAASAYLS
jgi:sugar phosphate permease